MNALNELRALVAMVCRANTVAAQKRKNPTPRLAQVQVLGPNHVRVVDFDTGRILGRRRSVTEARTLAGQLERGELCA